MGEQRRGRLQSVGAVLPRIAGKALHKKGLGEAQLITEWPSIIGEKYAKNTSPERLSFARGARRDGTLRLRVAPGVALEIQHDEPVLLERINGFFGYRAIVRLSLEQTLSPRPVAPRRRPLRDEEAAAIDARVAPVGDEPLRGALRRLGAAIAASERK